MFAGHSEVQRPHSVQVYAARRLFQFKSFTSLAPNLPGSAGGAAVFVLRPSIRLHFTRYNGHIPNVTFAFEAGIIGIRESQGNVEVL